MQQYTSEFKDQPVRFVFEANESNESRKGACSRLVPKVNVKEVTLWNWVKAASPVAAPDAESICASQHVSSCPRWVVLPL